jgi:hypothetical protein
MPHDPLEGGWQVSARHEQIGRLFAQDRRHRFGGGVATEGTLAHEHFVEHRAEREEIRARVERLPAHLLGRHVAHGAHDGAGLCLGAHPGLRDVSTSRDRARDAEVEQLDVAIAGDKHVLGFQVPVDNAALVRGGQPARDLYAVLDGLADWKCPSSSRSRNVVPSSSSMTRARTASALSTP